jgi:hypothetical protein
MSRELQTFLEECCRPTTVKEISSFVTIADYTKAMKEWKETTSTSPSGRHLGHYKTTLLDDRMTALHVAMLNLPVMHGFAPERWTHSITPLIEKDEGQPFLTRLRVIHLFEPDYNLFLKVVYGKHLVGNAEKSNALNDQQHGSRPRRMTKDALFLSGLEKDLIRQTKSNSAHMDNDATGCYDRIVTSVGMMASRRLGMTAHATRCQAATLRQMKYSVKHAFGTSTLHYTGSDDAPLFGTGQGSGASPAIWLGVVVILRISSEDNIPGLAFSDPWNDFSEQWRVGAFVDDTNQGVMDPIGIRGMSPDNHIIKRYSNESKIKGLGVYLNFTGTFSLHAKMMRTKFDALASRLSQSTLLPSLARVFYHSFYIPSVTYSLPVTSMLETELHKVQSKMTASILNKLGLNRHYPHAVAFAPQKVFGCGLLNLRVEQGLTHIQSLLDYVGTDHKVGRVMLISLRHLQVEAGISFDLLQQPRTKLSYLTNCWMVSLRQFCADFDISIRCKQNQLPNIARTHDSCLMDNALQLPFTKQELLDVNLVRLYHQVTTLSDIVSADGQNFHLSEFWKPLQFLRESPVRFVLRNRRQ